MVKRFVEDGSSQGKAAASQRKVSASLYNNSESIV